MDEADQFSVCGLSQCDYFLLKNFENTPLLNVGKQLEVAIEAISNETSADALKSISLQLSRIYSMVHAYLNTGHYSKVEDKYRTLFAYVCALQAKFEFCLKNFFEALRKCDDGLLKGNDLDNNFLSRFAEKLCADFLPKPSSLCAKPEKILSSPGSLERSVSIPCIVMPSLEEFYANYFIKGQPLIIRGLVDKWPAFQKWSFEYLNERYGHRTVPVELGVRYTDEDWRTKLMTLSEYFTQYVFSEQTDGQQMGYMAQHRLIDQIPELANDIIIPDYCAFAKNGLVEDKLALNLFVGPEGTISPLHTDPRHNFFCQVLGRKFVRLIDPSDSDKLYLFDDIMHNNTSMVDVENPNFAEFHAFRDAVCHDFLMEPGDCLFIPRRYFHFVKALERSISVSIWFGD